MAEAVNECQPTVVSPTKQHALYLWIVVKKTANVKNVVEKCKTLQQLVKDVQGKSTTPILAGVAFGSDFCKKVGLSTNEVFAYTERKGKLGTLVTSEGDVFVHAKSDDQEMLVTLCRKFVDTLQDSISSFEDAYGYTYKDSRDLSGFIDGTNNPKDEKTRRQVAVDKQTGGSYMVTQVWHHKFDVIHNTPVEILEEWIGRTMADSTELKDKRLTAHIARMRGTDKYMTPGPFKLVRQSQPIGKIGDKNAGLFFIAYAASTANFNYMLDAMFRTQDSGEETEDEVMKMSENVKGTYWYCPSSKQLAAM